MQSPDSVRQRLRLHSATGETRPGGYSPHRQREAAIAYCRFQLDAEV
jgi:hypothetical protein